MVLTLPDELEQELKAYLLSHNEPIEEVLRAALREYLARDRLVTRLEQAGLEFRLPTESRGRFTVAAVGSGKSDISVEHDKYTSEP
jgi:tRNA(Ile2) C34 agmatinyltransferase TiaS